MGTDGEVIRIKAALVIVVPAGAAERDENGVAHSKNIVIECKKGARQYYTERRNETSDRTKISYQVCLVLGIFDEHREGEK